MSYIWLETRRLFGKFNVVPFGVCNGALEIAITSGAGLAEYSVAFCSKSFSQFPD